MQKYDYRCENGHIFEVRRRREDKSPRRCPECRARAVRVFTGMPAIHWAWWNPKASSQATPPRNDPAVANRRMMRGVDEQPNI